MQEEQLHTVRTLADDFAAAGIRAGQTLLVHSSMRRIGGWICGGAEALIQALLYVLGPDGTLVMPTHTADNTDPSRWQHPPVPESWWQIIRDERPPYHAATSLTWMMGILPETFRTFPGVVRSNHPIGSFAAAGRHAAMLTAPHPLEPMFGDGSPIGRLYQLDAHILLLGVMYDNCTSLHLAEYRADFPQKRQIAESCAVLTERGREWITFIMQGLDTDDFNEIGTAFESSQPQHVIHASIGNAPSRLIRQRPLVDFAYQWMERYRR